MTDELLHEIEVLNRLEKELQLKWGRGDNMPADLLSRIENARNKIKTTMDLQQMLNLPVFRSDLGEDESVTIRDCLFDLLKMVMEEGECFNGKKPWGNSGWEHDIYATLIKHNLISGKLDENGYLLKVNEEEAIKYVVEKIIKPVFYQE